MKTAADRLREARVRYFETASAAARARGWPVSTYLAHENGQNRFDEETARRYARAFKVSWIWLLYGDESDAATTPGEDGSVVPIMGYVGAGGDVEPDFEQVPEGGLEQIELPAPIGIVEDPIGFRVRGESMQPRYNDGDIVVVERDQPTDTDALVGDEAVVRTEDGHRYLKRLRRGARPRTYDLVGLNGPTVEGIMVVWASPVRVIIPSVGLRRVSSRSRW